MNPNEQEKALAIIEANNNSNRATMGNLAGANPIQEDISKLLSDLPGNFIKKLGPLLNTFFIDSKFLSSLSNTLGSVFNGGIGGFIEDTREALAESVSGLPMLLGQTRGGLGFKQNVKKSDLTRLSANYSLPALLMYGGITEIIEILKNRAKTDNKSKGGDAKTGGSFVDKLKGMFENVGKGAQGLALLAGSLLAFAGASAIFSKVDWFAALKGLGAFTLFALGSIILAKILGKQENIDNFIKFAKGSLLLTAGFLVFSIAVFAAGLAFEYFPDALAVLGSYMAFLLLCVGITWIIKNNMDNFSKFTLGSLLLAAGLIAFSAAIFIAGSIPLNVLAQGGAVITAMMAILIGVGVLSKFVKPETFMGLATASILFAVAITLLSIPVMILGSMSLAALGKAGLAIVVLTGLMVGVGYLAAAITPALAGLAVFGLAATLFAVGLLIVSAPVALAAAIGPGRAALAMATAGIIAAGMLAVSLAGYGLILGMPGLLAFSSAALVLTVALAAFLKPIKTLSELDMGKVNSALDNLKSLPGLLGSFKLKEALSLAASAQAFKIIGDALVPLTLTFKNLSDAIDFKTVKANLQEAPTVMEDIKALAISIGQVDTKGVNMENVKLFNDMVTPLSNILSSIKSLDFESVKGKDLSSIRVLVLDLYNLMDNISGRIKIRKATQESFGFVVSIMSDLLKVRQKIENLANKDMSDTQDGLANLFSLIYNGQTDSTSLYGFIATLNGKNKNHTESLKSISELVNVIGNLAKFVDGTTLPEQSVIETQKGSIILLGSTIAELSSKLNGAKDISSKLPALTELLGDKGVIALMYQKRANLTALSAQNWSNLSKQTDNLVSAFNKFEGIKEGSSENLLNYIKSFDSLDPSKLEEISTSFKVFLEANLNQGLTSLNELANNAAKFEKIAKAFDKISANVENISKRSGIFTSLGNLENASTMAGASVRSSTNDTVNVDQKIYDLMKTWTPYIQSLGGEQDLLQQTSPSYNYKNSVVEPNNPHFNAVANKKAAQEEEELSFKDRLKKGLAAIF